MNDAATLNEKVAPLTELPSASRLDVKKGPGAAVLGNAVARDVLRSQVLER